MPLALHNLGHTMNLDATRLPRLNRCQVVDDERDGGVAIKHIAILAGETRAVRANEDLAAIQREAHGIHCRLPVGVHRGDPGQPLALKIRYFLL